ncbi:thioredoxin-like protein [Umbelopsis sp. PMI_123]|nr:thioredoxin-like protein [Umbelopsis sp. PMI_123]
MVKTSFVIAAAATAFLTFVQAKSDVIELSASTFDSHIKNEDVTLVEFFAPWCGHCKALAPEYEIAATTLKKDNIKIAKVDCTVEQDLCSSQNVQGYPTLKVFRSGTPGDYSGPRKADGIVSYMLKQTQPPLTKLDAKTYNDFKTSDKVVAIAYIPAKDKDNQKVFEQVANQLRDEFTFGLVTDKSTVAAEGSEDTPTIVIYKQGDSQVVYNEAFDAADIAQWVKLNSVPVYGEIDGSNFANYADLGLPIAYTFYENEEQVEEVDRLLKPLAEKYKGKISFVKIDGSKYGQHAESLAIPQDYPSFGVQKLADGSKFPLIGKKATEVEAVDELTAAIVDGTAKPHIKSAVAPQPNDGPVKVIVANEFTEQVLDPKKNVFLEVYAPWCGHCKNLAPIWEELGQLYTDDEDIVIAKMDGTENDIPPEGGFQVTGFPTLKFFKAGDNEIIDYNGDRSLESLKEFIAEHTGVEKGSEEEAAPADETADADDKHDEL